jgi:hypothetical protein
LLPSLPSSLSLTISRSVATAAGLPRWLLARL